MAQQPVLFGPRGEQINFKKAKPPTTDKIVGSWSGPLAGIHDERFSAMSSVMGFNLDLLQLSDFRMMRSHPQVNASLSVLSFMQHQSPWKIQCEDKKIADLVHEEIERNWTQLNRTMSQANWAGYSPGVLEWENDVDNRVVRLDKIKDLMPENAAVHWKEVEGAKLNPNVMAPKYKIYDGIDQIGVPGPIPVPNTFWYPMLMENGDYYGRKLLQSAFTPWYFSHLIHLYANRYYERYGEPLPVGRAPFDEDITLDDGVKMNSKDFMAQQLVSLRNRSVVVMPNDGLFDASSGKFRYDYELDFMESQMRGADFERHLERLDEEISLALFTPVLLMRTADVGSYNLGQGHMQVYLWMMNAMNSDRAFYINKYIIAPIVNYNFSPKAPRATIEFKKLGDTDSNVAKEVLTALINGGTVRPNLEEFGEMVGMTLEEVEQTVKPVADPEVEPAPEPDDSKKTDNTKTVAASKNWYNISEIIDKMATRIDGSIRRAYSSGVWTVPPIGHEREVAGYMKEKAVRDHRVASKAAIHALTEVMESEFNSGAVADADAMMVRFKGLAAEYLRR